MIQRNYRVRSIEITIHLNQETTRHQKFWSYKMSHKLNLRQRTTKERSSNRKMKVTNIDPLLKKVKRDQLMIK